MTNQLPFKQKVLGKIESPLDKILWKKIKISTTENRDSLENAIAERVNGILKR